MLKMKGAPTEGLETTAYMCTTRFTPAPGRFPKQMKIKLIDKQVKSHGWRSSTYRCNFL